MNMKTLKDIIEKQKKEEEEQKFDPAEQIEEYISLVEKLYTITLESIDELIKDGLIKQSRKKISINEESLGDYEIDSLILTINSSKIKFEPVGTMLIGSKGRVDVTGPFGKEKFILIRKGVKSPSDLIKVRVNVVGAYKPEKDKTDEDVKKPSIDDWEWKTMPSDSRWVKFDDVNSETITNIIMRMING
ncbi:Uncharacterised protein [Klebsiella pneumoniae]|jgi:hypothetical protein|nr:MULTISPECIES: hypothetical protein [Klebsiella/Raoultella group]MBL4366107.1 hypothetical protein [Klebsiella pneumoniae]MCF0288189.1 hypothetical protein [Klebsiella pneumoniae]MCL1510783.1 hypothetical protein [Klebsiella quasipneumoniae]MCL7701047.1 hypothetical protein [Klebsiella pneumoniae]MCQ8646618.1 hypothetical protein [Klebsiella pneumoniae]